MAAHNNMWHFGAEGLCYGLCGAETAKESLDRRGIWSDILSRKRIAAVCEI